RGLVDLECPGAVPELPRTGFEPGRFEGRGIHGVDGGIVGGFLGHELWPVGGTGKTTPPPSGPHAPAAHPGTPSMAWHPDPGPLLPDSLTRLRPYRYPSMALAAGLLLAVGVAMVWGIAELKRGISWVDHSYRVISEI